MATDSSGSSTKPDTAPKAAPAISKAARKAPAKTARTRKAAASSANSPRTKSAAANTEKPVIEKSSRKASAKSERRHREERRNKKARPAQLMTKDQILQTLHNEHRYMARIFEAFKEQMALLAEGQSADYNLMYDVMHYISHFPENVHHPREEIVFRKLMEREPDMKQMIEKIFIEHETQVQKGRNVLKLLTEIRREETDELREQLRVRCEDYLAFHGRHSALEEGKILPRVAEALTEADWVSIAREMIPAQNPLDNIRGGRYKALNRYITGQLETAAAEFTLAEFIGMGAFVESIGSLTTSLVDIGGVLQKHWENARDSNSRAFRDVWKSSQKRSVRGVTGVTVDCLLDNFDHYAEGLKEISHILRRARKQATEPYVTRMELFNEIEKELESRPL
ncbi:MAG TPA: hemerythrin domain-containing protein [Pseudomonadales bacterium]